MDLFQSLANEPYESRGILTSEIALILHTVRRFGVEVLIESGRARGQSTYLLGKYLPDVTVHSVELRPGPDEVFAQKRLRGLRNVACHFGDGGELVPEIAASIDANIGVLLDGPKGEAAVSILERCFEMPHVLVGFIHDMRKLDHGQPSPHRACAVARLPNPRFSDDPRLVAETSWMDAGALAANACGPAFEAQHGSYGPTLGVFVNQPSNQK